MREFPIPDRAAPDHAAPDHAGPGRFAPRALRHALLTPAEMARADALAAAAGIDGLMEHAGRAVARTVMRRVRPCPTLVLCGPGNNGGDGYVVARLLRAAGWPVRLAALAATAPGGDAAAAAARWPGPVERLDPAASARADLVIDALFGAGLSRPVDGVAADCLRAARRLIAIDMPSGIDGATGAVCGFAPMAEATVTFFRPKPGHLLYPGRAHCGDLVLADILIPPAVLELIRPGCVANHPDLWALPAPGPDDHKYRRGLLTILGGEMAGAARLAAAAARRAGAGLVCIAHPAGPWPATEPGVILTDAALPSLLADPRRQVWLVGPGLGASAGPALASLRAAGRQIVADADALTACAGAPERLRGCAIITPHAGEFARLFPDLAGTDRLAAARAAAARTGAVVILKGADTLIADPDGRCAINHNAPPTLATAGSGDVLAGIAAGLLAAGMAPWSAAAAAVWLHGAAATLIGPGLIAEDLPPALPRVMTAAQAEQQNQAEQQDTTP